MLALVEALTMTNCSDIKQAERHAYISGDTKKAAPLAEIIDLQRQVNNLEYVIEKMTISLIDSDH